MKNNQKDRIIDLLYDNSADLRHPLHVTYLSERLFDELKPLHNLGEHEKDLLIYASMLHDTGLLLSSKEHHKFSARFILKTDIAHVNDNDKYIIANIARYHRKALPSDNHKIYNNLSENDKKTVDILASILRIADGLDRTHLSLIKDIKIKTEDNKINIYYLSPKRFLPEEVAALKKSDLFEKIFKREVSVDWQKA
ncbi:exopolyphosphatase/guanosine-5'-triphosphate,3'-diphosphate pyrophosphatase [Methanomicrobium sp. W14]|uniref:HD domain-containing protein n=1 Tax=Methanomicrobium sp. W14 TaxID=2817839 RepID=UPI001AE301C1|nr:HD domain-containing protein [Methanomicrobium sp. W14]MBP2132739.1 exopolyphosphatase/guanosine-5'-triphosphate,3'-diphosphate pyrophosphatase [Methanomicrobium sp. W14]